MGNIPNLDKSEIVLTRTAEIESQTQTVGDNAFSQAMMRVLERVIGTHTRSGSRGSITKRLWSNTVELFKGVTGVAPTKVEYWLEVIERIMNNLDCTLEQKLKGVVSFLRNEAYYWWQTIEQGTLPK